MVCTVCSLRGLHGLRFGVTAKSTLRFLRFFASRRSSLIKIRMTWSVIPPVCLLSCYIPFSMHLVDSFSNYFLSELQNRPRSIYQYSNMAPRLSGQTSIFGVVFFVFESLLGIERQKKLKIFTILTRKPRSHVRILIYRTWAIIVFLIWRHIQPSTHATLNSVVNQYGGIWTYFDGA